MKEHKGLIALTMKYNRIVMLLVSILIICGIYALYKMPKQEFPVFTIRQGVVVGVYPGASSAEVEEQVAKPLEKFLFTYKEVKKSKTYSQSRDGVVYVFVELNDEVNNKDEVWSKIKHGLDNFKAQLPSGVLALVANDDFGDTSALLIALESDTKTYRQLQDYLEKLEDKLRGMVCKMNNFRCMLTKKKLPAMGSIFIPCTRPCWPKVLLALPGKSTTIKWSFPYTSHGPLLQKGTWKNRSYILTRGETTSG
jgi:hypothetical protein